MVLRMIRARSPLLSLLPVGPSDPDRHFACLGARTADRRRWPDHGFLLGRRARADGDRGGWQADWKVASVPRHCGKRARGAGPASGRHRPSLRQGRGAWSPHPGAIFTLPVASPSPRLAAPRRSSDPSFSDNRTYRSTQCCPSARPIAASLFALIRASGFCP
jgi:hypothetical protein